MAVLYRAELALSSGWYIMLTIIAHEIKGIVILWGAGKAS
jgi:hypothetical protein